MNEKQFLNTMIETLKWDGDDYDNKEKMLSILRYAEIDFEQTRVFTSKSYQFYEDIAIRVRIPMLKDAKELMEPFKKLVRYIYRETEEYDLRNTLIKPKPAEGKEIEPVEHSVAFEQIREEIIQGIRIAKYVIWVSVAWFTDRAIYEELLVKKKEGLQIRIITTDTSNNIKLKDELINEFDALFVSGFGAYGNNLMHNKFCIIDFEFVMHGSYNWSLAAEYNDETWITSLDKELVSDFAEGFKKLYIKHI
jgi:phosphatidylserine/phosphatidylglycerophosphate/cardiolipin synthase-like enzyme